MRNDSMIREMYIELTRAHKSWEYCGTKAAGLFALEAMGIPVPRFYVVPVSFFHHFCSIIQAYPLSEFYGERTYDSTLFQKCLIECKLTVVCDELQAGNGRLIVRSSAVPQGNQQIEEFSSEISGAFESFIADDFSKVSSTVLAVWQSVYSECAYEKLRALHQNFGIKGMSVVVQKYIEPVISGIVHTCSDKIKIDWITGSQEDILQGRTRGREIEVYLSDCKEIILRGKEDSIKQVAGNEWRTLFKSLYDWSMKIRSLSCFDQEIEWVYDGKNVWVVQSQRLLR